MSVIEVNDARVEMLAKTVSDLLAMIKRDGGFLWPVDQALLRRARAELAELGKHVNREDV